MKNICCVLFLVVLFAFFSCGTDKPDKLPSSNQKKETDKLPDLPEDEEEDLRLALPFDLDSVKIIFEGGTEDDRQFVFISNSNRREFLSLINDFSMPTKFETSMYRDTYNEILDEKDISDSLKIELGSFPTEWMSVYWYDHDYYLYCPARLETNYRVKLTDTSMMVFHQHGVNAEVLIRFEGYMDDGYTFETYAITDDNKVFGKETNVYFINESHSLAIWEDFTPQGLEYRLMIPAKYCNDYALIVNYGEMSKPAEFDFEHINYLDEIMKIIGE